MHSSQGNHHMLHHLPATFVHTTGIGMSVVHFVVAKFNKFGSLRAGVGVHLSPVSGGCSDERLSGQIIPCACRQ